MSRGLRPVIPMQKCLIATDLHCDGSARRRVWLQRLLNRCQELGCSLLLLGDLFDQWCGDDHLETAEFSDEIECLQSAIREGISISIIPGNRDFLLGQRFESATGIRVFGDSLELQWLAQRWHCSHGDLFGSEDRGYQRLRRILRLPEVHGVHAVGSVAARRRRRRLQAFARGLQSLPDPARVGERDREGARLCLFQRFLKVWSMFNKL